MYNNVYIFNCIYITAYTHRVVFSHPCKLLFDSEFHLNQTGKPRFIVHVAYDYTDFSKPYRTCHPESRGNVT